MSRRFDRSAWRLHDHSWPNRSVGDLLAVTVAAQTDALALVDGERRLTFGELADAVARTSGGLRRLGIGTGDVVAYQLPNWWEAVVLFLAGARLGAVLNPLLPSFRTRELHFTLKQSGARLVVAPGVYRDCNHQAMVADLRGALPELEYVVACRDRSALDAHAFGDLLDAAAGDQEVVAVDPDAIVLLMYTSGTTAQPKGVLHTHNTLAAEVLSLARVHQLGPGDRALMPSPVTHISGVLHGILTPAILGTAAVLMDRWEPTRALQLIATERITYMAGAPTFLEGLVEAAREQPSDTSSLRLFSCGGAAVSESLITRARAVLPACVAKRVYGSTEFPTLATTELTDALARGGDSEGRVIAPAELRVVDASGQTVAPGAEGEIQARGPECFIGYADPLLNQESFTADGWFRTGDLGVLDAGGYLRVSGRLKDIVVRKGEKISASEVEELIAEHPAVRAAAVIALPDTERGERACAVVQLRPGGSLELAELTGFLASRGLARPKCPEQLEIVDTLPRTASGKVNKAALRARLSAHR